MDPETLRPLVHALRAGTPPYDFSPLPAEWQALRQAMCKDFRGFEPGLYLVAAFAAGVASSYRQIGLPKQRQNWEKLHALCIRGLRTRDSGQPNAQLGRDIRWVFKMMYRRMAGALRDLRTDMGRKALTMEHVRDALAESGFFAITDEKTLKDILEDVRERTATWKPLRGALATKAGLSLDAFERQVVNRRMPL